MPDTSYAPANTAGDKIINCRDCRANFNFTEGEQKFYSERGYTEPKRCKGCRDARKNQDGGGASAAPPPVNYRTQPVQPEVIQRPSYGSRGWQEAPQ